MVERQRLVRVPRAQAAVRPEGRALVASDPRHPALEGWLAVPLTGRNGRVLGLIEVGDKVEGDFTEADESMLVQLQAFRDLYAGRLDTYEQIRASREAAATRDEFTYRALLYGIARARAAVEWADETLRDLAGPA